MNNDKLFICVVNGSNFVNAIFETMKPIFKILPEWGSVKVEPFVKGVACKKLPKDWNSEKYQNVTFWLTVDTVDQIPNQPNCIPFIFKEDKEIELTKEMKEAILSWIVQGATKLPITPLSNC